MDESGNGDVTAVLKETIGKWLALERTQQEEVWGQVGFDLFVGVARISMIALNRVEELENRIYEIEQR